jgi:hypothetical protein
MRGGGQIRSRLKVQDDKIGQEVLNIFHRDRVNLERTRGGRWKHLLPSESARHAGSRMEKNLSLGLHRRILSITVSVLRAIS